MRSEDSVVNLSRSIVVTSWAGMMLDKSLPVWPLLTVLAVCSQLVHEFSRVLVQLFSMEVGNKAYPEGY